MARLHQESVQRNVYVFAEEETFFLLYILPPRAHRLGAAEAAARCAWRRLAASEQACKKSCCSVVVGRRRPRLLRPAAVCAGAAFAGTRTADVHSFALRRATPGAPRFVLVPRASSARAS